MTSGKCSPPLRQMAAKTFARPGPPVPVPRRQGRATTTRFRRVTPVSAPKRTHARMQALTHVHMHRRAFTRTHKRARTYALSRKHLHTRTPSFSPFWVIDSVLVATSLRLIIAPFVRGAHAHVAPCFISGYRRLASPPFPSPGTCSVTQGRWRQYRQTAATGG